MTNSHIEVDKMKSIYPNLLEKMINCGMSFEDLAKIISSTEDVVSKKMEGTIPWTLLEAVKVCCYFHTSDVNFLFLQLDTNT